MYGCRSIVCDKSNHSFIYLFTTILHLLVYWLVIFILLCFRDVIMSLYLLTSKNSFIHRNEYLIPIHSLTCSPTSQRSRTICKHTLCAIEPSNRSSAVGSCFVPSLFLSLCLNSLNRKCHKINIKSSSWNDNVLQVTNIYIVHCTLILYTLEAKYNYDRFGLQRDARTLNVDQDSLVLLNQLF